MSVEISKLTIDVNGKKVTYTLDEARELWAELNKYFSNFTYIPWTSPTITFPEPKTNSTWTSGDTIKVNSKG